MSVGVAPIAVIIGYGVRTHGPKAAAATAGFIAGAALGSLAAKIWNEYA